MNTLIKIEIILTFFILTWSWTWTFWPGEWYDKYDWKGKKHSTITENAMSEIYDGLRPEFSKLNLDPDPDFRPPNFYEVVKTIYEANMLVDKVNKNDPDHHFDRELLTESNKLLFDQTEIARKSVMTGDLDLARKTFGGLLHTLQDFYSHTNWIESGRTDPHPQLGQIAEFPDRVANRDEQTCYNCTVIETYHDKSDRWSRSIYCKDDASNVMNTGKLTSGYYSKKQSEKPAGKCSHGGILPFGIAYDATRYNDAFGGINKDSLNRQWTHRPSLHFPAANMAERATVQHFQYFREKLGDEHFLAFLGLTNSLSVVVDVTPSMKNKLPKAKKAIERMADTKAEGSALVQYLLIVTAGKPRIDTFNTLIAYHDVIVLQTVDKDKFLGVVDKLETAKSIRGLRIGGGGSIDPRIVQVPIVGGIRVSPGISHSGSEISGKDLIFGWESTYYAVSLAAKLMLKGGLLHIFSDEERTNDTPDEREVAAAIVKDKHIELDYFKFRNPPPHSRRDSRRRRKRAGVIGDSRRAMLYDFKQFVTWSGGDTVDMEQEEAVVNSFIDGTEGNGLIEQSSFLVETSFEEENGGDFTKMFAIDKYYTRVLLSFEYDSAMESSADGPVIILLGKQGEPDDSAESLSANGGEVHKIIKLIKEPGDWLFTARNITSGHLRMKGWSSVFVTTSLYISTPTIDPVEETDSSNILYFDGRQRNPSEVLEMAHPGSIPLHEEPIAGFNYTMSLATSGCPLGGLWLIDAANTSDVISVIDSDEIHLLPQFEDAKPTAKHMKYITKIAIPESPFRVKVVCGGLDPAGKRDPVFYRISPGEYRPARVSLQVTSCQIENVTSSASSCQMYPGAIGKMEVELTAFSEESFDIAVRGDLVEDYSPKGPITGLSYGDHVTISVSLAAPGGSENSENSVNISSTSVLVQASGQTTGSHNSLSQTVVISEDVQQQSEDVDYSQPATTATSSTITPGPETAGTTTISSQPATTAKSSTINPGPETAGTTTISSHSSSPNSQTTEGSSTSRIEETSSQDNWLTPSTPSMWPPRTTTPQLGQLTTSTSSSDWKISSTTSDTWQASPTTSASSTAPEDTTQRSTAPPFDVVWVAVAVVTGDWENPVPVTDAVVKSRGAGQPDGYSHVLQGHMVAPSSHVIGKSDARDVTDGVGVEQEPAEYPSFVGAAVVPVRAPVSIGGRGRSLGAVRAKISAWIFGRECDPHCLRGSPNRPRPRYEPCDGMLDLKPVRGQGRGMAKFGRSYPYADTESGALEIWWKEKGGGRNRRLEKMHTKLVFKCE